MVTVCGYNASYFGWKSNPDNTTYQTTGILIEAKNRILVLTTRECLVTCNTFEMYYAVNQNVMRNSLHVIRQSVEYNLMLLATTDVMTVDFTQSKQIQALSTGTGDVHPYLFDSEIQAKTRKVKKMPLDTICPMYTVEMDVEALVLNFTSHMTHLTYSGQQLVQDPGMPELTNETFFRPRRSKKSKFLPVNTIGSIVFDANHDKIVAMMIYDWQFLSVIYIRRFVSDAVSSVPSLVYSSANPVYSNSNPVYSSANLVYSNANPVYSNNARGFPLTAQPINGHGVFIPYHIVRSIVIVQLTYELCKSTILFRTNISNYVVEALIYQQHINGHPYFIIVDCLDPILAAKYGLPVMPALSRDVGKPITTLKCPVILTINGVKPKSLTDVENWSQHQMTIESQVVPTMRNTFII